MKKTILLFVMLIVILASGCTVTKSEEYRDDSYMYQDTEEQLMLDFENKHGSTCDLATDGCHTYTVKNGKVGESNGEFCRDPIIEWKCLKETTVCSSEYNPVCSVNGKTYMNECLAGNTKIIHKGECCLDDQNPVCGVIAVHCTRGENCPEPQYKTYSNICDLKGDFASFVSMGKCED